jgi:antitoxin CptB
MREADVDRGMPDDRILSRLRWRCRRGMLENDLILSRFLDSRGDAITDDEVAALDRLLDLGDNDLWDLLSGHREPADAAVLPLLRSLRAI